MPVALSIFNRWILSVGLFAVALAAAGAARAQTPLPWRGCVNPCRVTAEVDGLKEGQGARLELHNRGDRPATAWLFFMDARGRLSVRVRSTRVGGHAREGQDRSHDERYAPAAAGRMLKGIAVLKHGDAPLAW